jgi:hypothetical protein
MNESLPGYDAWKTHDPRDDEPDPEPYCQCGNEPIEDEDASNQCFACGKPLR